MAVRTKQLAEVIVPVGVVLPQPVYTVPAGATAIVKLVTMFNAGPVADTWTIQYLGAGGIAYGVHVSGNVPAATSDQWPSNNELGWLVLKPGDVLRLSKFSALTAVHFTVHGTQLEGVAP